MSASPGCQASRLLRSLRMCRSRSRFARPEPRLNVFEHAVNQRQEPKLCLIFTSISAVPVFRLYERRSEEPLDSSDLKAAFGARCKYIERSLSPHTYRFTCSVVDVVWPWDTAGV